MGDMEKITPIQELINEFELLKKTKLYKGSFKAIDDCIHLAYAKIEVEKFQIIEQTQNDYKRGFEAGVESCNPKKVSYNEPCKFYLMGNNTTGACNNCNQPFNKHKFN